jgi:pimeloyl-ACP methyl ester carboxylesterase
MGAITALFFVSMYSELVDKFISLDAVKQLSSSAEYLPVRMKGVLNHFQAIVERLEQGSLPSMSYKDAREKLVKIYVGSIDEKDAEILLRRGLRKLSDEDEYEFTRDLRSTVRPYLFNDFTNEQLKEVARGIVCPFLLIEAKNSSLVFEPKELYREFYDLYRDASEDFRYVEVEGRHHVHLSHPELVAPIISNFLIPVKSNL